MLSVKFGALREPDGGFVGYDARPAAVKNFLAYTLRRLGVDYVDIYRPARARSAVPIEDTIGAIADLVKAGYVRHIGLSEVGADTIRRAHAVHPIADLQIEYSLSSAGSRPRSCRRCASSASASPPTACCRADCSAATAMPGRSAAGDFRAHLPRFSGENLERNLALVEALRGDRRGQGRHRRAARPSPGCCRAATTSCR